MSLGVVDWHWVLLTVIECCWMSLGVVGCTEANNLVAAGGETKMGVSTVCYHVPLRVILCHPPAQSLS